MRVDYFAAPSGHLADLGDQVRGLGDGLTAATSYSGLTAIQPISGNLQALAISYPGVVQSANFTQATATLAQIGAAITQLSSTPPADLPAAIAAAQAVALYPRR